MDHTALQCSLVTDPDEPGQLAAPFSLLRSTDMKFSGIPMPPSANMMYVNRRPGSVGRNGRPLRGRRKSFDMAMWERDFATWAMANAQDLARARALIKPQLKPGTVLAVHCTFFFQRARVLTLKGLPKRHDTSNYLKPLHDALAAVLQIDDSWIFDGMMRKRPVPDGHPRAEMAVVEIEIISDAFAL